MVKRVAQGDVVTIDETEYRFGPTSTLAFNATLGGKESSYDKARVMISIHRVEDNWPEILLFPVLKKAVEGAQAKEGKE